MSDETSDRESSRQGDKEIVPSRGGPVARSPDRALWSAVELQIDELILHGFDSADRAAIAGAVERELARLLAEGELPPSLARGGAVAHIDGGVFTVALEGSAEAIGAQVAQAIYGGLRR